MLGIFGVLNYSFISTLEDHIALLINPPPPPPAMEHQSPVAWWALEATC